MIEKILITDTSLVDSVRSKMATATPIAKGLLGAGIVGSLNVASSVLLCETTGMPVTGSLLLSVAAGTSNAPNLYYIAINRIVGNTGNPNVKVKVLSGSYLIKIKARRMLTVSAEYTQKGCNTHHYLTCWCKTAMVLL